eukprot:Rmarinus@m.20433
MSAKFLAPDLQEYLENDDNWICFECGQNTKSLGEEEDKEVGWGTWCSATYGVTLCLTCSGIHRSIGVHLSFVKSPFKDKWTPDHLAVIKEGGNEKAREFLKSVGADTSYQSPENLNAQALTTKYESAPYKQFREHLLNIPRVLMLRFKTQSGNLQRSWDAITRTRDFIDHLSSAFIHSKEAMDLQKCTVLAKEMGGLAEKATDLLNEHKTQSLDDIKKTSQKLLSSLDEALQRNRELKERVDYAVKSMNDIDWDFTVLGDDWIGELRKQCEVLQETMNDESEIAKKGTESAPQEGAALFISDTVQDRFIRMIVKRIQLHTQIASNGLQPLVTQASGNVQLSCSLDQKKKSRESARFDDLNVAMLGHKVGHAVGQVGKVGMAAINKLGNVNTAAGARKALPDVDEDGVKLPSTRKPSIPSISQAGNRRTERFNMQTITAARERMLDSIRGFTGLTVEMKPELGPVVKEGWLAVRIMSRWKRCMIIVRGTHLGIFSLGNSKEARAVFCLVGSEANVSGSQGDVGIADAAYEYRLTLRPRAGQMWHLAAPSGADMQGWLDVFKRASRDETPANTEEDENEGHDPVRARKLKQKLGLVDEDVVAPVDLEGPLATEVLIGSTVSRWKLRQIQIRGPTVYMYDDTTQNQLKNILSLTTDCKIDISQAPKPTVDASHQYKFSVLNVIEGKNACTLNFAAESFEKMTEWIAGFERARDGAMGLADTNRLSPRATSPIRTVSSDSTGSAPPKSRFARLSMRKKSSAPSDDSDGAATPASGSAMRRMSGMEVKQSFEGVTKAGWLCKEATKGGGHWKLRYVVFRFNKFEYYEDEKCCKLKGTVALNRQSKIEVSQAPQATSTPGQVPPNSTMQKNGGFSYRFKVRGCVADGKDRMVDFSLAADSFEDMSVWMDVIEKATKGLQGLLASI